MLKIGIIVFDNVEELDFIAPFEVLSYANKIEPNILEISLIAEQDKVLKAFNGLKFMPDTTFEQTQQLDILIVPGGKGRLTEMYNKNIHAFIKRMQPGLKYLTSVCTGSLILAEAGLLNGHTTTTHHLALEELANYPQVTVITDQKVVEDNQIITAAGVSSGLELGFHLLQLCFEKSLAEQVAKGIEYTPQL